MCHIRYSKIIGLNKTLNMFEEFSPEEFAVDEEETDDTDLDTDEEEEEEPVEDTPEEEEV